MTGRTPKNGGGPSGAVTPWGLDDTSEEGTVMTEATAVLLAARDALFAIADKLLTADHATSLAVEGAAIDLEALLAIA